MTTSTKELKDKDNGTDRNRHHSSLLSSSIDFLSQDQKVILAERSSRVSRPERNDECQKTQDEIWKKYFDPLRFLPTQIDNRRRSLKNNNGVQIVSSTENDPLEGIQERMNHFQREIDLEIKTQDQEKIVHNQKRKRKIICGICISILLLILITSLTICLIPKSGGQQKNVLPTVDSPFRVEDCNSESFLDPVRHYTFRLFLISEYPTLSDSIDTQGSSANLALCWLSQYDKLYQNPFPEHADALAQRFILVMLYFSFSSFKNEILEDIYFSKRNWLSQQHVCNWTNLGCQDSSTSFGNVTSLDFSDLFLSNITFPSEISHFHRKYLCWIA
jgi:hypothetical protein